MSRPKTAKKGDKDASPAAEAAQVNVRLTLDFTATPTLFVAPPSHAYDTRFSFSLLGADAVTSPPTSVWSPAAAVTTPAAVRWTSYVELVVSRETVLAMETGMLRVSVEQREAWVAAEAAPSSDELLSPSKGKAAKATPANKKTKATDKASVDDSERKSTAHPALTDDIPFVAAASFLLPLSTLLAAPHTVAFSSAARTNFVLPAGLSSLTCALHTNGTNPIHPSLLPMLLPLALSLTTLSSLPLPLQPSPYRPLSLSFTLPASPHTFAAPSLLPVSAPDLHLHPALYPTRVVLLGRLPRSALYETSQSDGAGVRVEVRDREHTAIPTREEERERERRQREEDDRREAEERERQREEERQKKKPAKAAAAIKSPKAAHKPTKADESAAAVPAAAEAVEAQAPAAEAAAGPKVVYDCRSNVYGMAVLSLVELFQFRVADVASVDVVSSVSAVLPPADVPLMAPDRRTNPYSGTLLAARLRLLHPLPPVSQLAAEAKYARAAVVWPREDEDSWLRVLGELLRVNARAVGVEDGEAEGQGSWQWLEAIKADEQPAQQALEPSAEQREEELRAEKEKEKGKGAKSKKAAIAASEAAPTSAAAAPAAHPPARTLQADHITGCVVMDGRSRWLFVEGLAEGEAWKAMEAAVHAERGNSRAIRLLLDGSLRFTSRSFADCPLSLSAVRLTETASALQGQTAKASTPVQTLSSLAALLVPQLVPDLQAACRTNSWLDAAGVRALRERVGREARLDEVYGKERGKREREIRKRRTKEVQEKKQTERVEAERRLEAEKQAPDTFPNSGSDCGAAALQQQPSAPQKPADGSSITSAVTAQQAEVEAAEAQKTPADALPATNAETSTTPLESTAEATLLALTIKRKRARKTVAPQSAPAMLPAYTYSNAAEYQAALRSLRAACHADSSHHYTFHTLYLHSSVPACESVAEADKEERRAQRRRWRTERGFVMPASRVGALFSPCGLLSGGERDKERAERRRTKSVNELVDDAWHHRQRAYNERREVNFYTQPLFPSLFDKAPQRSVHLSGVEQVEAERAKREREEAEWEAKVCVDDSAIHVLWGSGQSRVVDEEKQPTADTSSCRLFGLRGLRKDEPVKRSLQFRRQQDGRGHLKPTQRQLVVDDLPVSITNVGEWRDPSSMRFRESEKRDGQAEFVRYHFPHQFIHRPHIQP